LRPASNSCHPPHGSGDPESIYKAGMDTRNFGANYGSQTHLLRFGRPRHRRYTKFAQKFLVDNLGFEPRTGPCKGSVFPTIPIAHIASQPAAYALRLRSGLLMQTFIRNVVCVASTLTIASDIFVAHCLGGLKLSRSGDPLPHNLVDVLRAPGNAYVYQTCKNHLAHSGSSSGSGSVLPFDSLRTSASARTRIMVERRNHGVRAKCCR
jgi:hypothetical protein